MDMPKKIISFTTSSAEERAQRLRRLRNLANLSRKDLCEKALIKIDTLIGWEVARHGGLTENGAIKIIDCIKNEGVVCTLEWLLYGINDAPHIIPNYKELSKNISKKTSSLQDDDKKIINELLFFKESHHDTVELIISDDSMQPHYNKGDYVAGIKKYKDKFSIVINSDCIVQTLEGIILFRKILPGDNSFQFNLIGTNFNSVAKNFILKNVNLCFAAPVIWHRRKDV